MTRTGQLAHCKTLADLVAEYNKHFKFDGSYQHKSERSVGHHDPVIDYCKEAPDLATCIERAVEGRSKNGKMFSEGSCVRAESKAKLTERLTLAPWWQGLEVAKDFETIYDIVRDVKPWGIGNLTVYNVAARIAAYKGIKPEKFLYLHAGPLVGWKRLTGTKGNPYRVPLDQVPAALRVLEVHQIEDFCCEMRDVLNPSFCRELT
jgi:hypothetical protein